jgi:hypothetical protein
VQKEITDIDELQEDYLKHDSQENHLAHSTQYSWGQNLIKLDLLERGDSCVPSAKKMKIMHITSGLAPSQRNARNEASRHPNEKISRGGDKRMG